MFWITATNPSPCFSGLELRIVAKGTHCKAFSIKGPKLKQRTLEGVVEFYDFSISRGNRAGVFSLYF